MFSDELILNNMNLLNEDITCKSDGYLEKLVKWGWLLEEAWVVGKVMSWDQSPKVEKP